MPRKLPPTPPTEIAIRVILGHFDARKQSCFDLLDIFQVWPRDNLEATLAHLIDEGYLVGEPIVFKHEERLDLQFGMTYTRTTKSAKNLRR